MQTPLGVAVGAEGEQRRLVSGQEVSTWRAVLVVDVERLGVLVFLVLQRLGVERHVGVDVLLLAQVKAALDRVAQAVVHVDVLVLQAVVHVDVLVLQNSRARRCTGPANSRARRCTGPENSRARRCTGGPENSRCTRSDVEQNTHPRQRIAHTAYV